MTDRRIDLIDLFEMAGIKVTPKPMPAPEVITRVIFPSMRMPFSLAGLSQAVKGAIEFQKAMVSLGKALADPMGGVIKAFEQFIDALLGIPRKPSADLSHFERELTEMERDRCRRINGLQNRLLDVRY